jgi:D-beta-D-heptose 7-phosphate kinase/D-beta-D-heptose 1-phosphate adenosyltransferase
MSDFDRFQEQFAGQRVLVVGDVMLDEYIWGKVQRVSPEAPVPVVELVSRTYAPGGAGNAAANVSGLGAKAILVGAIGKDEAGARLLSVLKATGIGVEGVHTIVDRPTTTKTRIIAHSQQVVRIDHEVDAEISLNFLEGLLETIDQTLPHADVCLLTDHAKGVVSKKLSQHLIQKAKLLGKAVIVDPKGFDFEKYQGATVFKPNLDAARKYSRSSLSSLRDIEQVGQNLLQNLKCRAVLITRGAEGMSLFESEKRPLHLPAQAREAFDVTGAGDTVAAVIAVALAAGASLEEASRLAGLAASIVVGQVGTKAMRLESLRGG